MKFHSFSVLSILFLLVAACSPTGSPTEAPAVDRRFRTSVPSQLYFKNIRSTSYQLEEDERTQTNHYTLRNVPDTARTPFLVATIIENWLHDQAYLSLSWRALPHEVDLPITFVQLSAAGEVDTLMQWHDQRWGSQYEIAGLVHEKLQLSQQITIQGINGQITPVFKDGDAQRAFQITYVDFLNLTDF